MMTEIRGASNAKAKRELGWRRDTRAGGRASGRERCAHAAGAITRLELSEVLRRGESVEDRSSGFLKDRDQDLGERLSCCRPFQWPAVHSLQPAVTAELLDGSPGGLVAYPKVAGPSGSSGGLFQDGAEVEVKDLRDSSTCGRFDVFGD